MLLALHALGLLSFWTVIASGVLEFVGVLRVRVEGARDRWAQNEVTVD